jgi:hypothetical protein
MAASTLGVSVAAIEMKIEPSELARRVSQIQAKFVSHPAVAAAQQQQRPALPRAEQAAVALGFPPSPLVPLSIPSLQASVPVTTVMQSLVTALPPPPPPTIVSLPMPGTTTTTTTGGGFGSPQAPKTPSVHEQQEDAMDLDEPTPAPAAAVKRTGPPPPKNRIKSFLDVEAEEEGKDEEELSKSGGEEGGDAEKNEHGIYKEMEDIVVPDSHVDYAEEEEEEEDVRSDGKKKKKKSRGPLPHVAAQLREDEALEQFMPDRKSRGQVLRLLAGARSGGMMAKDRAKLDKLEKRDEERRARGEDDLEEGDNAESDDEDGEGEGKKEEKKKKKSTTLIDTGAVIADSTATFDAMDLDQDAGLVFSGLEDATPTAPRDMAFGFEDKAVAASTTAAAQPRQAPPTPVIDLAAAEERKKATISYDEKHKETAAELLGRIVKMDIGQRAFKDIDTQQISHFLRAVFMSYAIGPINMKPMTASLATATQGDSKSPHNVESQASKDLAVNIERQLERMRGFDFVAMAKGIQGIVFDQSSDMLVKARLALMIAFHLGYASFLERSFKPARTGLRCALSGLPIPLEGQMQLIIVVLDGQRFFLPVLPWIPMQGGGGFTQRVAAPAAAAPRAKSPPSPAASSSSSSLASPAKKPATEATTTSKAAPARVAPSMNLYDMAIYDDDAVPRLGEAEQPLATAAAVGALSIVELLIKEKLRVRIDRERTKLFNFFANKILQQVGDKKEHRIYGYRLAKKMTSTGGDKATHVSLFRDDGYPELTAGEDGQWARSIVADLIKFLFVCEEATEGALGRCRLLPGTGKDGIIPVWISMEDTAEAAALQATLKRFRWRTFQSLVNDIFGGNVAAFVKPLEREVQDRHPLLKMMRAAVHPDHPTLKTPPLFPSVEDASKTNGARHRFVPRLMTQLLLDYDVVAV